MPLADCTCEIDFWKTNIRSRMVTTLLHCVIFLSFLLFICWILDTQMSVIQAFSNNLSLYKETTVSQSVRKPIINYRELLKTQRHPIIYLHILPLLPISPFSIHTYISLLQCSEFALHYIIYAVLFMSDESRFPLH